MATVLFFALAPAAFAHEEEKGVPAVTDVQEAIAIIAGHQGSFPEAEVIDLALDKVMDALESDHTEGVDLDLVRQAKPAVENGDLDTALVLLERSIGACPGAPVINPNTAPRTPPALASPCPSPAAHLRGLSSSPVHGAQEPVFLAVAGVLILAGLVLVRRIR